MQGEKTLREMFPFAAQMISCKLKNKIGTEVMAPLWCGQEGKTKGSRVNILKQLGR